MLLVIIIVKWLLQCVRWTYICACTRNWVAFICSLPRIITLFSTCVSVNFYPLRELDTIESGSMDLIITYSGLPPQPYPMHQFTNPPPSHLPLSSSSQMYTPLYFANSRKQRQGNTQSIWQEQCTIYCTAMLLKVLVLAALNSICKITNGKLLLTDSRI